MHWTERWKSLCLASLCFGRAVGCGGGGGSVGTTLGKPVPGLAALTPDSAQAGGAALTVAASGNNFVSTSEIVWNGAALVTTYVSGSSLTAQVAGVVTSSGGLGSDPGRVSLSGKDETLYVGSMERTRSSR